MKIFGDIATAAPDILLPAAKVDLEKWAVIACDQFTSEPEYWQQVEDFVKDAPSTLRLVLPEVWLPVDTPEQHEARLQSIASNINLYLSLKVLNDAGEGFVVLDRKTPLHPSRKGLVLAVDLEKYSFEPGNKELIRATEGTVLSRIPPRVKIRANAKIELPHIMLLINDPEDKVIGQTFDRAASSLTPCYDTDLMQDSGHVTGYFLSGNSDLAADVVLSLKELLANSADGMLFAVGDGNHSLASAKAHWDNVKKDLSEDERRIHPARYALAEVVNIHDKGLDFEPIHRVVFDITKDEFIASLKKYFADCDPAFGDDADAKEQKFVVVAPDGDIKVGINNPPHSLSVGSVQMFLDDLGKEVDYIHGEDSVRKLSTGNNIGILLPDVSKDSFFSTIEKEGVFPRKTFSMGEAFEKRFYLEAKRIV